jgi:EpsI family protein
MNWKSKEYWIVITLLVLTGIYVNILRYTRVTVHEQIILSDIQTDFSDWKVQKTFEMDEKTLNILKSDQEVWRKYVSDEGFSIHLFVAYFKDQKYGAQIHSPIHCVPGGGWKIIQQGKFAMQIHNSPTRELKMNKMINSNGRYKEIMLYWFWTRSGVITNEYSLKIDLAKNALFRKPTDAAFVRFNFPMIDNDQTKTLEIASDFILQIFPSVQQVLPFGD